MKSTDPRSNPKSKWRFPLRPWTNAEKGKKFLRWNFKILKLKGYRIRISRTKIRDCIEVVIPREPNIAEVALMCQLQSEWEQKWVNYYGT